MKLQALLPFTVTVAAVRRAEESPPPGAVPSPLPVPNLVRELGSCSNLSCPSDPSTSAICARDVDEFQGGVGLAAQAMELPSANLSLTLTDGLDDDAFTHYKNSLYRYSDVRLYVGLDPDVEDDDLPQGCMLMMQYQQQTFPQIHYADGRDSPDGQDGTTSCEAVLDPFCQSDILKMIRGFNASSVEDDERCDKLVAHVAQGLRSNTEFCGSTPFLSNLMNVTGGPLPTTAEADSSPEGLGEDGCKPVLPSGHQLHAVAQQKQFFLADPPSGGTEYYSHLFGGRAGFTPVIGVFYNGTDSNEEPSVQLSCMQTLRPNGEQIEAVFEATASLTSRKSMLAVAVAAIIGSFTLS